MAPDAAHQARTTTRPAPNPTQKRGTPVTYYELNLTIVTENPNQAIRASEALNHLATGFALEGLNTAQSIDTTDDYYNDEDEDDELTNADTTEQP